jgi:hypothetical protein
MCAYWEENSNCSWCCVRCVGQRNIESEVRKFGKEEWSFCQVTGFPSYRFSFCLSTPHVNVWWISLLFFFFFDPFLLVIFFLWTLLFPLFSRLAPLHHSIFVLSLITHTLFELHLHHVCSSSNTTLLNTVVIVTLLYCIPFFFLAVVFTNTV